MFFGRRPVTNTSFPLYYPVTSHFSVISNPFSSSWTISLFRVFYCPGWSTRAKVVVDHNPRLLAGSQPWALLHSARQLNTTSSAVSPTTTVKENQPPCDLSHFGFWPTSFLDPVLTIASRPFFWSFYSGKKLFLKGVFITFISFFFEPLSTLTVYTSIQYG